jgi:stage II sporulation protein D
VILSAGGPRKDARIEFEGTGRIEGLDAPAASPGGPHVVTVSGGALQIRGIAAAGAVRFLPDAGKGVRVGTRLYDGAIEASVEGGALVLRNLVPFSLYLEGVVAGEMPASFPAEALRVQAILARSYALSRLAGGLTDDPGVSQAYPGRPPAASVAALRAAVASTRGMRLVDAVGAALPDYWYHSTCGGRTAPASTVFGIPSHPAYVGVACDGCTASKFFRWDLTVSESDLRSAVRFGSPVVALELGPRDTDGRTVTVLPRTAAGTVRPLKATELRFALGTSKLRSTLLDSVEARPAGSRAPSEFIFRGKGWGHGVGLCQMGAGEKARRGERAEVILRHYYPGAFLDAGGP